MEEQPKLNPRPIGDRVLVRQDPPKTMAGLIHIPDVAGKDYPSTGTVVATGPGLPDGPLMEIAAGDRVLFKRRPGSALIIDDRLPGQNLDWKDLVMLRLDDILGVITEETEVVS